MPLTGERLHSFSMLKPAYTQDQKKSPLTLANQGALLHKVGPLGWYLREKRQFEVTLTDRRGDTLVTTYDL